MNGRQNHHKHRKDKVNMRPRTSIESKRERKRLKKRRKNFLGK